MYIIMWRRQVFRPLFNLFFFLWLIYIFRDSSCSVQWECESERNSPGMMKVELCVWFLLMSFLADTTASLKAGAFLFAYHSQGVKKPECLLVGLCQCYLKQALPLQMEFSCLTFWSSEKFSPMFPYLVFTSGIKRGCSWRSGGKWKFCF